MDNQSRKSLTAAGLSNRDTTIDFSLSLSLSLHRYTCSDYLNWNLCSERWMKGWCRKTCGQCVEPPPSSTPPVEEEEEDEEEETIGESDGVDEQNSDPEDLDQNEENESTDASDGGEPTAEEESLEARLEAIEDEVAVLGEQVMELGNKVEGLL